MNEAIQSSVFLSSVSLFSFLGKG